MDCCLARALNGHSQEVTVKRPGMGTLVKGRWQTQDTQKLTITTVVQPLRPEEVLRLEDSRHIQEALKLYTQTRLFPVDVVGKIQPDIVVYKDHEYEVESVADWGSFYKVIAVRREQP